VETGWGVEVVVAVKIPFMRFVEVGVGLLVTVLEGVEVTVTMVTVAPTTGRLPKLTACPFVPVPAVTLKL
jgi:hypothetical protein